MDTPSSQTPAGGSTLDKLKILRSRNFGLLWVGGLVAMLGDGFTLVAFPWLVIQLSDSALALGAVLAVRTVPRAIFILVGGAITDRFSPLLVILSTRLIYLILMALLAVLVLSGTIELWMVFLFSLLTGTVGAFAYPAHSAILPQLVSQQELPLANSIMGGIGQICLLVGPAMAGLFIVWLSGGDSGLNPATELQALGYIFALDACSLLIASTFTLLIRIDADHDIRSDQEDSLLGSIKAGAVYLFQDGGLFRYTLYMGAIMFLAFGAITVGIPLLAHQHLPEGAAAYGLLMSAVSGGMLLGIVLAGLLPHPHPRYLGSMIFILDVVFGPMFILLGWIDTTVQGMIILFSFGVVLGYMGILLMTWIQQRIPQQMLGRMMSMTMFATVGVAPLSGVLSGYLIELAGLRYLFTISGSLIGLVAVLCLLSPKMRAMGLPPDRQLDPARITPSGPDDLSVTSQ
ncbi:MAG: MFS transporter [Pseudomonadales bacterium]|nr:MFS transporter [Pseudomonadales bacterium]MDP7360220.1 MFS transporter [Pseudomonadales bacterium]MDP7596736.1 MFS transporter [Pseudomonadales bacterium]HJN50288.1 MFS transporter [Pseudomonadales bacterium]